MRFLLLLAALGALAQNPATITVTTTLSATAGSGTTAVTCSFTNQGGPQVNCPNMPAGLTLSIPAPNAPAGSISGLIGSTASANSITWIFTAASNGAWNYSITANAIVKTGTF